MSIKFNVIGQRKTLYTVMLTKVEIICYFLHV